MRAQYKDTFLERHGVKLGFMSFFTKAVCEALQEWPALNAEVDDDKEEFVYKDFYNIGIAVGSERGLVVPVLRDADKLSFAALEQQIKDFGQRAQAGKISSSNSGKNQRRCFNDRMIWVKYTISLT